MANTNKLYVGNLDYDMTADDLRAVFEEVGEVEEAIQSTVYAGFGGATSVTPASAGIRMPTNEYMVEKPEGKPLIQNPTIYIYGLTVEGVQDKESLLEELYSLAV